MSTKIYNGYRLPKFSFEELMTFNKNIREDIRKIAVDRYNKLFTYKVISIIDDIDCGILDMFNELNKEFGFSDIKYNVQYHLMDRIKKIKVSGYRDPEVDFETVVTYIPIKGKILALFYAENNDIVTYWNSLLAVKDYHYQDSGDKPDELTNKQWDRRLSDWELALDGINKTPMECGMSYTFVSDNEYFKLPLISEILGNIPTYEDRLRRRSEKAFLDKYVNDLKVSMTEEDKKEKGISLYLEGFDLLKKEDPFAMSLYKKHEDYYRTVLTKEFTGDILKEKLKYGGK